MSRYSLIGAGATVGIAAVGISLWYYKKKNSVPTNWRKVGELSELMCFPLKSGGVIRENELECTFLGVKKGMMRDRVFMIISEKHTEFVTARTYPSILLIVPKFEGDNMILSAPGMMDHVINMKELDDKTLLKSDLRGDLLPTIDCGGETAKWVSRFLLREDTGFRLVYYPYNYPLKVVRDKHRVFPDAIQADTGGVSDATSYMLCTESSLADLNGRLENKVNAQRFRPNFVVKNTVPYEEDNWKWIKIGKDAVFHTALPCTRCVFTNVDPDTAERDKNSEPLKTLKKYRQVTDPKIKAAVGDSPVFGAHLGLRVPGVVKLGDPVYVSP